jgi:hypothetical protein
VMWRRPEASAASAASRSRASAACCCLGSAKKTVTVRRIGEAESEFCSERAYIRTPRGTLNPPWHAIWPLGRAARPPFESQDSGGDWV